MRKLYYLFAILSVPAVLALYGYSSGYTEGGKSGSIGDGGSNCTACHSGTPMNQSGWITTNMLNGEWVPGQSYTITATATHAGVGKFGFELTAENATGEKMGTFSIINATETQLTNPGTSVTHTTDGGTPSGDSKTWEMQWTAPSTDEGEITFYAAINAANGNGNTSGDVVYLTRLQSPQSTIGIEGHDLASNFVLYPNPTSDYVHINFSKTLTEVEVQIINQAGAVLHTQQANGNIIRLNLGTYANGIYFINLYNKNWREVRKVLRR